MAVYPESFESLKEFFKKMPGIGDKSAERMALSTIELPLEELENASQMLILAKKNLRPCSVCGYLTDQEDTATGNTTEPKILSSLASSDTASSAGVPSSLGGYVLKTGAYSSTATGDDYRLRMWIADTATAPESQETYTLRVNVYGQANAQ